MGINAITIGIWAAAGGSGSAVYNQYADPYWDKVLLMMHSNTLADSGPLAWGLTNSGVTVNTTNPKFGTGALYFNGSSYIYTAESALFNLSGGDLTIEFWFNLSSVTGGPYLLELRGSNYRIPIGVDTGLGIWFNVITPSGGQYVIDNAVPTLNEYHHLAAVVRNNTMYLYKDGVLVASLAMTYPVYSGTYALILGRYTTGGSQYLTGYLDDIRITKGVARYNANFTPPARSFPDKYEVIPSPYDPYFNNVYALLHSDQGFVDRGKNALAITANAVTPDYTKAAFGSSSAAFNGTGSGSSLSAPTGAPIDLSVKTTYTFDAWVYCNSYANAPIIMALYASATYYVQLAVQATGVVKWMVTNNGTSASIISTALIPIGRWAYIAVSVNANVVQIYCDGVLIASGTPTTLPGAGSYLLQIGNMTGASGQEFTGDIDEARLTLDVARYSAAFNPPTAAPYDPSMGDPYWDYVVCQINGDTLTDVSPSALALTNTNVTINTSNAKFGAGALYFNGNSNVVSGTVQALNLSAGDFTIEAHISPISLTSDPYLIELYSGANVRLAIQCNAAGYVQLWGSYGGPYSSITSTGVMTLGVYHHIALTRSGSTWYLFLNGAVIYSGAFLSSLSNVAYRLELGAAEFNRSNYFTGYMDDLRITKGIARYTAAFTPPVKELPILPGKDPYRANVVALLNGDTLTDASPSPLTLINSGVTVNKTYMKYGIGSLGFNGSSYIYSSSTINFSSSDFVIEGWFYATSLSNSPYLWEMYATGKRFQLTVSSAGMLAWGIPSNSNVQSANGALVINSWTHIAVVLKGTSQYIFVNGVLVASGTLTAAIASTGYSVHLGWYSDGSTQHFNGYMDDLRITKGVARYTAAFVPPTHALPLL